MSIVTLGELLIDMFPAQVGVHLVEVEAFTPKPGGAPANVAVAVRRLGFESAFIGKVGDDHFGRFLEGVLESEGVDTRGIRFDPEARTTMAIIGMPDPDTAEFVFYRNPGADHRLRPEELDTELLASAKAFHCGSLSLTDEPARQATHTAVEQARDGGALVSYDVNYRPSLWPDAAKARQQAQAMLGKVDLLKVNEAELALLAGAEEIHVADESQLEEAARSLLAHGPGAVVVTLGRDGSYYQCEQGGRRVPGFSVETVDAVGCGDAFVAGLLTKLVEGDRWRDGWTPELLSGCLRFANAVGALTSLRRGVIPALPTRDEVEAFLRSGDPLARDR